MAIINNFPCGNSELAVMYNDEKIFPALVKPRFESGQYAELGIGWKNLFCGIEDAEHIVADFIIYPLRTMYISPVLTSRYGPDERAIVLEPGHKYEIYRSSYPTAEHDGEFEVKKDDEILFSETGFIFNIKLVK